MEGRATSHESIKQKRRKCARAAHHLQRARLRTVMRHWAMLPDNHKAKSLKLQRAEIFSARRLKVGAITLHDFWTLLIIHSRRAGDTALHERFKHQGSPALEVAVMA